MVSMREVEEIISRVILGRSKLEKTISGWCTCVRVHVCVHSSVNMLVGVISGAVLCTKVLFNPHFGFLLEIL